MPGHADVRVIGANDEHRDADRLLWPDGVSRDYHVAGPASIGWSSGIRRLYSELHPDLVRRAPGDSGRMMVCAIPDFRGDQERRI